MFEELSKIYADYCNANHLPSMSADELLVEHYDELTIAQRSWLNAFVALWEETQKGE